MAYALQQRDNLAMLASMGLLLREASTDGYALGAFNVYNLEGVRAVVSAAEAHQSPVMLQLHERPTTRWAPAGGALSGSSTSEQRTGSRASRSQYGDGRYHRSPHRWHDVDHGGWFSPALP